MIGTLGKPVSPGMVRQLQHEEGLVSHICAHQHRQLESHRQYRRVDGAPRRRSGKNYEARVPAGESLRGVLWQRRASRGNFTLDNAPNIYVVVSKAKERSDPARFARRSWKFLEKLVRLNEEWILLKKAPNNDHWMGSDDLHNAI